MIAPSKVRSVKRGLGLTRRVLYSSLDGQGLRGLVLSSRLRGCRRPLPHPRIGKLNYHLAVINAFVFGKMLYKDLRPYFNINLNTHLSS